MLVGVTCCQTGQPANFDDCIHAAVVGEPHHCRYSSALLTAMRDNQKDREGAGISATTLQACPRFERLKQDYGYTESPGDYYPRFRGSLIHAGVQQMGGDHPEVIRESRFFRRIPDTTDAWLSGTIDELLPAYQGVGKIVDYKSAGKKRVHDGMEPRPEHVEQLSIYRWILAGEPLPVPIALGAIRYVSDTAMVEVPVELDSLESTADLVSARYHDLVQPALPPVLPSTYTKSRRTGELTEQRHWKCGFCPLRKPCDRIAGIT